MTKDILFDVPLFLLLFSKIQNKRPSVFSIRYKQVGYIFQIVHGTTLSEQGKKPGNSLTYRMTACLQQNTINNATMT